MMPRRSGRCAWCFAATALQSAIWQTIKIKAKGIDIEVEDGATGDGDTRPVVLPIMGLGMQLVAWPPAPVHSLSDAGYPVTLLERAEGSGREHQRAGE